MDLEKAPITVTGQTPPITPGTTTPNKEEQSQLGHNDSHSTHPHHAHHHLHLHSHHHGKRVRHFFRPDGRKVHIASSPEEKEKLAKALSQEEKDRRGSETEEDAGWELVLHGSEEHISALRETHNHHERRRESLRAQHGPMLDEFEGVIRELDALSSELHHVSEHAVQLDASFSKYGYSAHLRTKDSGDVHSHGASSPGSPGSIFSETSTGSKDWHAERHNTNRMVFWKKPIVRQYFHKGLLWRASNQQEVASYELFVDLFYVAIIAISGDNAAEHPDGTGLLRFMISFILAWKFWSDVSLFISWFDADDIMRRLSVLVVLTCLLGFTTNIAESFGETWTPMVAFYLAGRFFGMFYFLWTAYLLPMVRPAMIAEAVMIFIPSLLWIGSCHLEFPEKHILVWIAIPLDVYGGVLLTASFRGTSWMSEGMRAWCQKTFEFFPGVNIEHRIERTGAFVTLVFGYSVVGLLYQNTQAFGINAFFGKAVLSLILAFSFNWLYFEVDSFNLHTHAIRRHFVSAILWMFAHLPFIMAYVLAGASLSKMVLAHDTPDSDPHDLTEFYLARSEEHIHQGQRWFFCAGIATALVCMGLISLSHVYRHRPGQRLSKRVRLAIRFAVALAILFLPLAHDINSLHLISITTCLVVLVLAVELIGDTCAGDSFWWETRRRTSYSAKCSLLRKDLEATIKKGEVLDVQEVAARGGGLKGEGVAERM